MNDKELQEISVKIQNDLDRQILTPRIFLGKCQTLDGKDGVPFQDHSYLPFYYYLGKYIPAENLVNVGFGLGLPLTCYLMAYPPTLDMLALQDPDGEYYHPRMALKNIKTITKFVPRVFVGSFIDEDFQANLFAKKWQLIVVSERRGYDETLFVANTLYDALDDGGVLCVEGIQSPSVAKAFDNFCAARNRDSFKIRSRYGNGLVAR